MDYCFLRRPHAGAIVRTMHIDAHFRRGPQISIVTDACPSGMGGYITVDGWPVEFFTSRATEQDARNLGLELKEGSTCQQAFEALALLIALRLWKYHWSKVRCTVHVATDNIAALTVVCKMQTSSPSLGVIAREMALDVADAVYEPTLATHIPGVANITADALSRRYVKGAPAFEIPPALAHSTEVTPEDRDERWWRTLYGVRQSHSGLGGHHINRP